MTSKKFYIYTHRDKKQIEGRGIFYVGKGVGRRAYDFTRRNQNHTERLNQIKRRGDKVEVVFEFIDLTNDEAINIEIEMIGTLGRLDEDEIRADYYDDDGSKIRNGFTRIIGPLLNQTDGGEGGAGIKWTEERRRKAKEQFLGKYNPMFGKTGFDSARGKEVICLNDGRVFGSSITCAEFYKIKQKQNVRSVCDGNKKSCEGKVFAWNEDYKNNTLPKGHGISFQNIELKLIEIDHKGNKIDEWMNTKECSVKENLSSRSIQRVCRKERKSYKGRIFRYQNDIGRLKKY